MQIIKPHGRSHVEQEDSGKPKRILRLRLDPDKPQDIEEFARSHDELVIAQWISAIDKIARKPAGEDGATKEQRDFRQQLGEAAWALLEEKKLLPGLSDPKLSDAKRRERKEHLKKLWEWKIHPYGEAKYEGKPDKEPSPKGRWYERFAGTRRIARKIHEHLYFAEYRIRTEDVKGKGLIAARAQSIAKNVLQPGNPAYAGGLGAGWVAEDQKAYEAAGDVAQDVLEAARVREEVHWRVTASVAGKALYEHYARVFRGHDGMPLPVRDIVAKVKAKKKERQSKTKSAGSAGQGSSICTWRSRTATPES